MINQEKLLFKNMQVKWTSASVTAVSYGDESCFAATTKSKRCSAIIALRATNSAAHLINEFFKVASIEECKLVLGLTDPECGSEVNVCCSQYSKRISNKLAIHQRHCEEYLQASQLRNHSNNCTGRCSIGRLLKGTQELLEFITRSKDEHGLPYLEFDPYGKTVRSFHLTAYFLEMFAKRYLTSKKFNSKVLLGSSLGSTIDDHIESTKNYENFDSYLCREFIDFFVSFSFTSQDVLLRIASSATFILRNSKPYPELLFEIEETPQVIETHDSSKKLNRFGLTFDEHKLLEKIRLKLLLDLCQFLLVQLKEFKAFLYRFYREFSFSIESILNQTISNVTCVQELYIQEIEVIDLRLQKDISPKLIVLFTVVQKSYNLSRILLLENLQVQVMHLKKCCIILNNARNYHTETNDWDDKLERLFKSRANILELSYSPEAYQKIFSDLVDSN